MKYKIILIPIILILLVAITSYIIYYDHYSSVLLFDGNPEYNVNIFRQSNVVDKFYNMYEKYGIEIGEVSDSRIIYAFVSTDNQNRNVTLTAKFFDGKVHQYYYNCSQIEPRQRIFLEEDTITQHCFETNQSKWVQQS